MWEKVSKVSVQNMIAVVAVLCCFTIAIISMFHPIPQTSETFINKVTDISLLGVMGYLYTKSKT